VCSNGIKRLQCSVDTKTDTVFTTP
jgi:hypothetical protein